jgi:hypothetical protein
MEISILHVISILRDLQTVFVDLDFVRFKRSNAELTTLFWRSNTFIFNFNFSGSGTRPLTDKKL